MGALRMEDLPSYTYEDYAQWEGDWELIDGIAYAMAPAPMRTHQSLAYTIARVLGNQIDRCPACEVLGEVDYKLSDDTVLRPDVVLTCGETREAYLTKAPEIIVEVISPSTASRDEKIKFSLYEAEKVTYYVLVYPKDLIAKVYRLDGKAYDKEGVFAQETYRFEDTACKVEVDFSEVFKRYRD